MIRSGNIKKILIGNTDELGSEYILVFYGLFMAEVVSLIGLVINIFLFGWQPITIITLAGSIFYLSVYLIARILGPGKWARWVLTISVFIYLDIIWQKNFGSQGPVTYIYIITYSIYLFLFNGKERSVMILLFLLNTFFMFLAEFTQPQWFGSYNKDRDRLIDIYSGLGIYLFVATFLMIYIKRIYVREKLKAQHSDRLKSAFLANLSHEFRTPMNSILGFSQLLDRDIPPEKRRQYLDTIHKNGEYLIKLIDDILDISAIEAGEFKIRKSDFSIRELFQSIHTMLSPQAKKLDSESLEFTYYIADSDMMLHTDKFRLSQILINLITNSLKFTEKGFVKYSCIRNGNDLVFSIEDSGIGISPEFQKNIFQRFYKIEPDQQKLYPGTGIGLNLCKELVTKLNGRIWFSSQVGKGTNFQFSIPFE